MTKVVKKHIKRAIIFYEDPDTGMLRRVVFGEPEGMIGFFMDNASILMERFSSMLGHKKWKKAKTPKEFLKIIKETRGIYEKENFLEAKDKSEMSITYEVK